MFTAHLRQKRHIHVLKLRDNTGQDASTFSMDDIEVKSNFQSRMAVLSSVPPRQPRNWHKVGTTLESVLQLHQLHTDSCLSVRTY